MFVSSDISLAASALLLAVALAGEIIGTIAGFGVTTILLPVAVLILGVKEAVAIVGLFHFLGEAVDGIIWRKYINWRIGLLFSSLGVAFAFIGALLVAYAPQRAIEVFLGIFLIIYGSVSLLGKNIRIPRSDFALVIAGGISGFLAGILGTAGAVRTAALSSFKLNKEKFLGTAFAIAFLLDLTRVSVYLKTGLLRLNIGLIVVAIAIAVTGSLIGKALVHRISNKSFYKIISTALLIAGIKFLLG